MENFDAIIVGCGIAGCTAAFEMARGGQKVAIISSAQNTWDINSARAQGGIVYRGVEEEGDLARDILVAGGGACNEGVVNAFARIGPNLVKELLIDTLKVPFFDGLTKEAAHSCSRVLFAHDQTGLVIMQSLIAACTAHPNITFIQGSHVIDLCMEEGRCCGVHVHAQAFTAPKVVLATGGAGDLFLHTSNSREAKGEGIAIAERAGAALKDLHYVQFHPTAFHAPNKRCFLLSEAMRGEGARLFNCHGESFVPELAPRDIVARAVYEELKQGAVYLDATQLPNVTERFPKIAAYCLENGIDIAKQPIPTVPCAHYICGGVEATLSGKTNVAGLYAIGEVACTGIHGANRLASTSLLEGLVMGKLCAEEKAEQKIHNAKSIVVHSIPEDDWHYLRTIMWEHFGIIRTQEAMLQGEQKLTCLSLKYAKATGTRFRNSVQSALHIARSALQAPMSVGSHYIRDTISTGKKL